jgi:hypothetical protein
MATLPAQPEGSGPGLEVFGQAAHGGGRIILRQVHLDQAGPVARCQGRYQRLLKRRLGSRFEPGEGAKHLAQAMETPLGKIVERSLQDETLSVVTAVSMFGGGSLTSSWGTSLK